MTCEIQKGNEVVAIICRRPISRKQCSEPHCAGKGDYLCDFVLVSGKTCDRPICGGHAIKQGEGKDYCPPHSKMINKIL